MHIPASQGTLTLGASEPNWNGFPQIAQITRQEDHDYQLERDIPLAQDAYGALFLKETEIGASLAWSSDAPGRNERLCAR